MKVVYDGPQPTRTVELSRTKKITATAGQPFEVEPARGNKLIRQRYFAEAKSTPVATPTKDKE